MGKRYRTVLARLGQKCLLADVEYERSLDTTYVDRVIITTPTQTHYRLVKFFATKGIPILCEKPVCTSVDEILQLQKDVHVDFRVVCNWSYVLDERLLPEKNEIVYRNMTSGNDGLAWDCIQLIYLSDDYKCDLGVGVPWDITINGVAITPKMIEDSYTKMMADWLTHPERLWGMQDAVRQTVKAEGYITLKSQE